MNNKWFFIVPGVLILVFALVLWNRSSPTPAAQAMDIVALQDGDTYDLTATKVTKRISGIDVPMLAYNGSIPGPLLKVAQGAQVTVRFHNETDVGSTIHSHGLRLDNAFDGVPDHTQPVVPPGGSFTYTLTFPDAGLYWYHPHFREDYAQELGLYGGYLVTPTEEGYWSPVNREVPLFLDDLLMEGGELPFRADRVDHTLMGRFGNVMLVNGETDYTLRVNNGEAVRFFVANVANTRPFRFAIAGAQLKLVGGDSGAYEQETWQDAVTLGPSERAVVEVLFNRPGTFAIQNKTPGGTTALGKVVVSATEATPLYADTFNNLRTHAETVASIDPFREAFNREPDKRLRLAIEMTGGMMMGMGQGGHMMPDGTWMGGGMMMGSSPDGIEWEDENPGMNAQSDTDSVKWKLVDEDTGKEGMDMDWAFQRGTPVKIRLFNDPRSMHPMQHPIHFHGQRFLVLARNGVEETNLVWKDTVLIPAGQTVDILLDPSNPGTWMMHCHISEHLEAGMMSAFTVE